MAPLNAVCSNGRKTLSSPADGLSVPTKATSMSGQKPLTAANPNPVASIRRLVASNSVRTPVVSVEADGQRQQRNPNSIAVVSTPTCKASKPRVSR